MTIPAPPTRLIRAQDRDEDLVRDLIPVDDRVRQRDHVDRHIVDLAPVVALVVLAQDLGRRDLGQLDRDARHLAGSDGHGRIFLDVRARCRQSCDRRDHRIEDLPIGGGH